MDDWTHQMDREQRLDDRREARNDSDASDQMSIQHDWDSEFERAKRELTGQDFLDVLFDDRDVLLTLVRMREVNAAAKLLTDALREYAERQADISIFGKPLGKK